MKKNIKFIIGGAILVLLSITGHWFLSPLINPPAGGGFFGRICFPTIFLIILIISLNLVSDSLIKN